MKTFTLGFFGLLIAMSVSAQKTPVEDVANLITKSDAEAHLTFLAADEMRGRNTGSRELDIAANYIASNFKQWGLKPAPGTTNYFQAVELERVFPASVIDLTIGQQIFKVKDEIVMISGGNTDVSGDIVFVGYGTRADFEKAKVKGKIAIAFSGSLEDNDVNKAFAIGHDKNAMAKEFGATALVEILMSPGIPWTAIVGYLHKPGFGVKKEDGIPHLWLKNSDSPVLTALKKDKKGKGSLTIAGSRVEAVAAKNVAAVVEGTDPVLKNEYIVISAHYDHVGVKNKPNQPDSIYNGARDNAIGTVGMLETARFFSKYPQKRSVLLLALTAEEAGLLGSSWYSDHPLIPLKQTVFNFNCDGAGYNDTSIATIIGMERTTAEPEIAKACEAFGLKATLDPVPEQNLYERSDNYNFARKGVPAIDFAPGTKAFDAELMKYYHQPADEVGSLDFDYLIKYFRAYVYTNYLLANMAQAPVWKAGDKFEPEAKKLYGK